MIQDIGEHRFDLSFRQPEARDEDYVLYMKSNKTLLRKAEDGNYEIPRFSDFPMEKVRLKMKAYYPVSYTHLENLPLREWGSPALWLSYFLLNLMSHRC